MLEASNLHKFTGTYWKPPYYPIGIVRIICLKQISPGDVER